MKRLKMAAMTVIAVCTAVVGFGSATMVGAQDATPSVNTGTVSVLLEDVNGENVGTATFSQGDDGMVTINVQIEGLAAGEHGIHVHEYGICDPSGDEPFSTAGGHYNPTAAHHGGPPMDDAHMAAMSGTPEVSDAASPEASTGHAGDLGNITVDANGNGTLTITTDRFTLDDGPASLNDLDGSAIVIHQDVDDLATDPSGNSGPRIACGVVFPPQGTPVAG